MPDSDQKVFSKATIFVVIVLIVLTVCFTALILTTPLLPNNTIAHFDVTDGEVNGTLKLGSFGYCLYLPNKDCQTEFLYKIGQFLFQPSRLITILTFCDCDFKDTHIHFQGGPHAQQPINPVVTRALCVVNLGVVIATISLIPLYYYLGDGWFAWFATSAFALIGAVFAISGIVLIRIFIVPLGAGAGFYFTIFDGVLFFVLFIFGCYKGVKQFKRTRERDEYYHTGSPRFCRDVTVTRSRNPQAEPVDAARTRSDPKFSLTWPRTNND